MMTEADLYAGLIIASSAKQIGAMLVALVLVYFGYRLFYLVEKTSGDLIIDSKLGKVRLLKATPGIFLTFFGSAILIVALLQHTTVDGNILEGRKVFGGVGASSSINSDLCAQTLDWAKSDIVNSQDYIQSQGPSRSNYDKRLDDITIVLSECVDAKLGEGAYRTYSSVQKDIDSGNQNVDDARGKIHTDVRTMLDQ